jgi:signal transduction histidine kinase
VAKTEAVRALGRVIGARARDIEQRWLSVVCRDLQTRPGVELTQLRDGVPDYLRALHRHLVDGDHMGPDEAGAKIWSQIARGHGITRVRIGFDVDQLIHEFVVLRHTIEEVAMEHRVSSLESTRTLADLIDAAIIESVKAYVEARNFEIRRTQAQNIGFLTHELRNPLSAAVHASELVRDGATPQQRALLDALDRSHARLIALIDGVLDAGRLEASQPDPKPAAIREGDLIARATEAARRAARLKGLAFEVRHDPARVVHVDPDLTSSALQNLVDNAVKYTDHGAIELTVEQGDGAWTVHVRDTCHGLSPEELRTIFEPFRRGSTNKPGTGLGLAIARRAIESQSGTIHAESPGAGCHFWFELPSR